jgi:hypothetical protein
VGKWKFWYREDGCFTTGRWGIGNFGIEMAVVSLPAGGNRKLWYRDDGCFTTGSLGIGNCGIEMMVVSLLAGGELEIVVQI